MKAFVLPTIFTAVDRFTSKVNTMGNSVDRFVNRTTKSLRAVKASADNTFSSLGGNYIGLGIIGGLGLAAMAVRSFVKEASKIEDAAAFFTPVLGSVQKANKLVEMLNIEAANTPFRFEDLSSVASSLLPLMDGDLNKVISTFRLLGDTAGGNVDKLKRITLGYTKALLKGKVTLESLNIIAEAGVPIFSEMAKTMNLGEGTKGTGKLFKMITKGLVPTEMLTKTFEKMGAKGGLFYQGMITASQTFNGITSTLEDNVSMTSAAIGTQMLPLLKEYAVKIIEITGRIRTWVESHKELIKTKFREFVDNARIGINKFIDAVMWAYKNIDTIIFWLKIYIGTLLILKVTSIAIGLATNIMTVAMFGWRTAIILSRIALIGLNAIASMVFLVQMVKYVAATRGLTIAQAICAIASESWTAAMISLNVAMYANPIGLIIAGIVLMIAYIAIVVKYYDKWGAALTFINIPLGMIINLIMSFKKNWDMIVSAFKNDGILSGLKAIGKTFLDAILYPMQQLMELVAKFTGADWAKSAADSIKAFRTDVGVDVTDGSEKESLKTAANPQQERTEAMAERMNGGSLSRVALDIATRDGVKANVTSNKDGIPIKTKSTHTYGQ